MSDAIEVLKEIINNETSEYEEHEEDYNELPKKYGNFHLKKIECLKEALLALEQKENDKGWVCDVCSRETASCLSLCPDCNNRNKGALEELRKDIVALNKNLDEMYEIYSKLYDKQNNTQSMAVDIACESRIRIYELLEKYIKETIKEKKERIKELEK